VARTTITDALREMRDLYPVDAGRLTGIRVYDSYLSRPDQWLADTPPPWRDRLLTAITARTAGTITADTPEYLVLSGRVVVVVLTVTAQVVLPDVSLSANQAKHQTAAAQALRDLPRDTLRALADQRARWDGREEDAETEHMRQPDGALRVAPATDPTTTRWVHIGTDLAEHADRAPMWFHPADSDGPGLLLRSDTNGIHLTATDCRRRSHPPTSPARWTSRRCSPANARPEPRGKPATPGHREAAICEELTLYAPAINPLLAQLRAGADAGFTTFAVTVTTAGLDIASSRHRHRSR
jgi:hypothetical protein